MNSIALTKRKISADISADNLVWLQDAAREKKISVSLAIDTLISLYRKAKHYELTDEQAARVKAIVDDNYRKRLDSQVRRTERKLAELKARQDAHGAK